MHARIRNNCSNLSHDMFINHLSPNLLCSYKLEIENVKHFFCPCKKFVNERAILFRKTHVFHPLNLNKLLIDELNETTENNILIFKAVQKYQESF